MNLGWRTLPATDSEGAGSLVEESNSERRRERQVFVFLVVFLGPILAVAIVGGYGFAVWMSQLIFGLPGGH